MNLQAFVATTPGGIVSKRVGDATSDQPLANTVLLVPDEYFAEDVVFLQQATNCRIEGIEKLQKTAQLWDEDFQTDLGVQISIGRISTVSPSIALVKWNVSWVPPTALWLEGLGKAFEPNVEIDYVSYNHLAQKESTFSWNAVLKLIADAVTRGKLKVPLACIEGNTEVQFSTTKLKTTSNNEFAKVVRLTENLAYAQDLSRGVLRNRRCAQDLRIFLESGRRPMDKPIDKWDDQVAVSMPWQSVPGSGPLDVEAVEEGPLAAVVFVGFAIASVFLFANLMGPELIGQSLFGPPNYIVRPEDLQSIY